MLDCVVGFLPSLRDGTGLWTFYPTFKRSGYFRVIPPGLRLQILGAPRPGGVPEEFGIWSLELLWSLEFGVWSFPMASNRFEKRQTHWWSHLIWPVAALAL